MRLTQTIQEPPPPKSLSTEKRNEFLLDQDHKAHQITSTMTERIMQHLVKRIQRNSSGKGDVEDCGKSNHGHGKALNRQDCPAFGKLCNSCGMKKHFSQVCEQRKTRASFIRVDDDNTSQISTGYSISKGEQMNTIEYQEISHNTAVRSRDFREASVLNHHC